MPAEPAIRCKLDHLVVCARELQEGVSWFEQRSGLTLPFGGSHPLMATHNHLSALSDDTFLEIIAADPQAAEAARTRWFSLDDVAFRERLDVSPQLATWVVGTPDLKATLKMAKVAGVDAGEAVDLTRGDLQWQIGLRSDGTLAYDGVFPILIQWPPDVNPVSRMLDQGLRLNKLHLQHPQAEIVLQALRAIGVDHLASLVEGDVMLRAQMNVGSKQFHI